MQDEKCTCTDLAPILDRIFETVQNGTEQMPENEFLLVALQVCIDDEEGVVLLGPECLEMIAQSKTEEGKIPHEVLEAVLKQLLQSELFKAYLENFKKENPSVFSDIA